MMAHRMLTLLVAGSLLFLSPQAAGAEEMCDLAQTVAERGVGTFKQNQAEGLKLLIQAKQLCESDPAHAYNLGVAFYQYGRLDEAISNLSEANQKGPSRAQWTNNLAAALVEKNNDPALALKYASQAADLAPSDPAIQETLARARFAAGDHIEALKGLSSFKDAVQDSKIRQSYTSLLDTYLTAQLEKIQSNRVDEGLRGLQAAAFDPEALRAYLLALSRVGRAEQALTEAEEASRKFPRDAGMQTARAEAAEQVTLGLFKEFQKGNGARAVQNAKQLAGKFPQVPEIAAAYEKLLEAFLSDAAGITVPEATARKHASAGASGRAKDLLASLGGGQGPSEAEFDLSVDIDQNIPTGKKAGRYDVAVVIGNRDYSASGTPNVDFAARDAGVVRQYLVRTFGYDPANIIYAEDATYAKFSQIFGSESDHRGQLYQYVKAGQSNVFVYYVGHGAPDLEKGEAFFVPVDANPEYLKTSGYRVQTFYNNLAKLPAKQITIVLDACFSGNSAKGLLFKGVSSITMKVRQELDKPASAVVFTSAQDDQVSAWYPEKRHSLFTYFFLKGLQGEADVDRNGKITVAEIEGYLTENVPYTAQKLKGTQQHPTVTGDRSQVLAIIR